MVNLRLLSSSLSSRIVNNFLFRASHVAGSVLFSINMNEGKYDLIGVTSIFIASVCTFPSPPVLPHFCPSLRRFGLRPSYILVLSRYYGSSLVESFLFSFIPIFGEFLLLSVYISFCAFLLPLHPKRLYPNRFQSVLFFSLPPFRSVPLFVRPFIPSRGCLHRSSSPALPRLPPPSLALTRSAERDVGPPHLT